MRRGMRQGLLARRQTCEICWQEAPQAVVKTVLFTACPRPGASRLWKAVSLPEPLPAGNRRPETPPAARAPGAVGDEHRSNHRLARPAPDASLERRSVSTPEPVPACFLCGDWRPDGEAIEPEAARSIERSGTRSDRSRREQLPPPHAQRWADRTFPETVSVLMVSDSWPA